MAGEAKAAQRSVLLRANEAVQLANTCLASLQTQGRAIAADTQRVADLAKFTGDELRRLETEIDTMGRWRGDADRWRDRAHLAIERLERVAKLEGDRLLQCETLAGRLRWLIRGDR